MTHRPTMICRDFFKRGPGSWLSAANFSLPALDASKEYRCSDGIYDVVNDALLDLVATGRIPRQAYEAIVFPVYFRTVEELVEPVVVSGSPAERLYRVDRVAPWKRLRPSTNAFEKPGTFRPMAGLHRVPASFHGTRFAVDAGRPARPRCFSSRLFMTALIAPDSGSPWLRPPLHSGRRPVHANIDRARRLTCLTCGILPWASSGWPPRLESGLRP